MSRGSVFGLIGDPVGHSISPVVQAAAFEALGIDARYFARRTSAADVEPAMRELARSGGGNVTIPHKEVAAACLDAPSEAVMRTGACNCFWGLPGGELAGDNTDVLAFADAVALLPGVRLRGARLLLLGAGGGARAVLFASLRAGAGSIDILNRRPARAAAAAAQVVGARLPVTVLERAPVAGRYDLVVNATSLGLLATDPLPIDLASLDAPAAFDLVYGRHGTRWTDQAEALGMAYADGVEMVVRQAGYSIRRWLDVDPPLDVMRRAAEDELRGRPGD